MACTCRFLPRLAALGLGAAGCTADVPVEEAPFGTTTSGSTGGEPTAEGGSTDDGVAATDSTDGGAADESSGTTDDDPGGALCGDGVISGAEECDCAGGPCTVDGLGGATCVDVDVPGSGPLTGGTLGCNPASCRYDTSQCSVCGDGEINGDEVCDGMQPIDATCMELGKGTAGEITCNAQCELDTRDCTFCAYAFDFASCDEGWTTGRTDPAAAVPSWECGDPVGDPPYGPPGVVAGAWATRLDGYYSGNESSFLQSPPLDFSMCAGEALTLTLTHWFNFESQAVNADGGIVQVSGDGETWTTLTPTGGTGYGADPIVAAFPPVDGALGFDGTSTADDAASVQTSDFDLSDWAGRSAVHVRFVFGSDTTSVTAGWYLDALEIVGGA